MSKPILMGVVAVFCMASAGHVLAATPGSGGAPKAEKPESTAASQGKAATKYCILDTVTGSHIQKKTCLTRKEWLAQGVDPLEQ